MERSRSTAPPGATSSGTWATSPLGTLARGQAGEGRVQVQVDDLGAAELDVRVARAVVASGVAAARAAEATQVESSPLALSMTAAPDPVAANSLLTYSLTVTNRGSEDSAGVILRMPVPEGLYGSAGCSSVSD